MGALVHGVHGSGIQVTDTMDMSTYECMRCSRSAALRPVILRDSTQVYSLEVHGNHDHSRRNGSGHSSMVLMDSAKST